MTNKYVLTSSLVIASLLATPAYYVVHAQAATGQGQGEIVRITDSKIAIRHGAIKELNLPAMTLNFAINANLTKGLAVGDKVKFTAQQEGDGYRITQIKK